MKLIPLTRSDDSSVWVNFDNVTHMGVNSVGDTVIHFNGCKTSLVTVKESPREIRDLLQESTASE